MFKKSSNFDEFLVKVILADIFDPSGSDDFEFVSRKIVNCFDAHGMIKIHDFYNEADLAA